MTKIPGDYIWTFQMVKYARSSGSLFTLEVVVGGVWLCKSDLVMVKVHSNDPQLNGAAKLFMSDRHIYSELTVEQVAVGMDEIGFTLNDEQEADVQRQLDGIRDFQCPKKTKVEPREMYGSMNWLAAKDVSK